MKNSLSTPRLVMLVALRIIIGWHLFYEGFVKITNPDWSSYSYLIDSKGIFSDWFITLANNPDALSVVDFLNAWGLTAIGLGLMLGFLTQVATIAGIVLLAFYYLSHPPFTGLSYVMPSEGSYLVVNKTLIEMTALLVLVLFPTGRRVGLDRIIFKRANS